MVRFTAPSIEQLPRAGGGIVLRSRVPAPPHKGYLNQRAVLARRAAAVARLYDDGDPDVIRAGSAGVGA